MSRQLLRFDVEFDPDAVHELDGHRMAVGPIVRQLMIQLDLGQLRALLTAGCDFLIPDRPESDARTTWVKVTYEGFAFFEGGIRSSQLFYVPTWPRLQQSTGRDWY